MYRRIFQYAAVAITLCVLPGAAQACDEECVTVYDINGAPIGHGCRSGDDGTNCHATVEECTIDYCGAPVAIVTGAGLPADVARFCSTLNIPTETVDLKKGEGIVADSVDKNGESSRDAELAPGAPAR